MSKPHYFEPKKPDSYYMPMAGKLCAELLQGMDEMQTKQAIHDLLCSPDMSREFLKVLLGIAVVSAQKGHRDQASKLIEIARIVAGLHFATADVERQSL